MLLKSLKMRNFRQYKGEQLLTFSTNADKNVTVVLGKNTSGKTTLMQAFNWALYGKVKFDTDDFLFNLEIANAFQPGDSDKVEVVIELIHDGVEYIIKRSQVYKCIAINRVESENAEVEIQYKMPDGQTDFISNDIDKIDTINKILPEDLSGYFFFDGERITNLGKNDLVGRKDISEAVEGVLGLKAFDNAITHLKRGHKHSVAARFSNSLDVKGDEKLRELNEKVAEDKEERDSVLQDLEDNEKAIAYFKTKYKELSQILKDNEKTAELQKKVEENEASIRVYERKKNKEINKIIKVFSRKGPHFFMQPLISQVKEMLDGDEYSDKGIPHVQSSTIDFLLERGKCICGEEIQPNSSKYNALLGLKRYLPPEYIGTVIKSFLTDAKHYNKVGKEFWGLFADYYKNSREFNRDILVLRSENDGYNERIKNTKDIKKIKQDADYCKGKSIELNEEKKELLMKKGALQSKIEKGEKEKIEQSLKTKRNRHIGICLRYVDEIANILEEYYNEKEQEIRRLLQERVNCIFEKMYHGERKLIIDDKYRYSLKTPNIKEELQTKADKSMGLETVASFAFISGILALAKEKVLDEKFKIKSEPYPLVMDAPFSNADEEHVKKISNIIPEIAEQVIIFIMHKDWKYAEGVLSNKLDKMYDLGKKTETYTIIKEC